MIPLAPALSTSQPAQGPRSQMLRAKGGESSLLEAVVAPARLRFVKVILPVENSHQTAVNNFWNKVSV